MSENSNASSENNLDDNIVYETMFNQMPLGFILGELIFDENGNAYDFNFLQINPAFTDHTGLTKEIVLNNTWKEISGDLGDSWTKEFEDAVSGEKTSYFIAQSQVTSNYYEINAFFVSEKKFVAIVKNITEEEANKRALIKNAEKFEKILEPMHEMHVLIELVYNNKGNLVDFIVIKVNQAFEKLTNIKKSELEGKSAKSVFGDLIRYWLPQFETVDKFDKPVVLEQYMKELNKHYRNSAWKVGKGKIALIATDISERKEAEQELIRAREEAKESSRLKSAFLANMSHEIRTPMNGILGFTSLLQDPNISGSELLEYTSIIQSSGKRMLNIINNIIDISKIEAGAIKTQITRSNINDHIEYIYIFFKPQAEDKGLKFSRRCSLSKEEAFIHCDSEKIYAILTNLIKNALKFTDYGSIKFGYQLIDNFIEFYVKDTGIGISSKAKQSIFERFMQVENYNTKVTEGTGLGLSISKAYVEMMGGTIWVESTPNKGSIFHFTIPNQKRARKEKDQIQIKEQFIQPNATKSMNIVVADDDDISNYLLTILLRKEKHNVLQAANGQEAVDFCRKNNEIDLVLMDIRMPLLNGYEATRRIREFDKNVIIIAQTAFGLSGDKEKAIAAGCNDYLNKPINEEKLLEMINVYFPQQ